jgi:hypothetical protein
MVTSPIELQTHIEAGLPPPAPVSSHILTGLALLGAHHDKGTQRIDFTSGGVSDVVQIIPSATKFSGG